MFFAADDMAINKAEWENIRTVVRDALSEHEKGRLQRLKSWSPLSVVVALGIFWLTQWSAYTEFRVHTQDRLTATEGRLGIIEGQLRAIRAAQGDKAVLKELAGLDPKTLAQNLPALRAISQQPPIQFSNDLSSVHEVAHKLGSVSESTSDYWPTAADFLNFASRLSAPNLHPKGTPVKYNGVTIKDQTFSDQTVIFVNVIFKNVKFVRCVILFEDLSTVTMQSVTFEDCDIEFPMLPEIPPNPYRQTIQQLLASNIQHATLNVN